MSRRMAAGALGCLLLATGAQAADRKPAYDPSLWSGAASSPRAGGTLSQDLSAPASMLPGTLSGSATSSPARVTPPPSLPAPVSPPVSANPSVDPWREPRAGMGQRPWGEIPQRFQSDGRAAGAERPRDPPVIIIAPGYMPGQLPGGNALSFPFGYTPGGYGSSGWLTPGLGYGPGYPGDGGIWPGGMGGWPGGVGGLPFNVMPFSWD